jgi:hypothetical protein
MYVLSSDGVTSFKNTHEFKALVSNDVDLNVICMFMRKNYNTCPLEANE